MTRSIRLFLFVVFVGALPSTVQWLHSEPGLPRLAEWTSLYAAGHAPQIASRSALLMDADTGAVLYEKDADLTIPPASLTKLVAMHVAFDAAVRGWISLDDTVEVPAESWARNMAPGSSLMFLGPDQTVTVREILLGLSVSSGNDAAVALAGHVAGSVPAFVDMMNDAVREMGLPTLFFVEPSGLSAENTITAREFAQFVRHYLAAWPQAATLYHSVEQFTFPHSGSYTDGRAQIGAITQFNRNSLLASYPGTDGLKTGFIRQSRYNLALTAFRDGRRLIAVILGAPGDNHLHGDRNRSHDATQLLDYGFDHFRNIEIQLPEPVPVRAWGGNVRYVTPVVNAPKQLTVATADLESIGGRIIQQEEIDAPVAAGTSVGTVWITASRTLLLELPVVIESPVERGSLIRVMWDAVVRLFLRLTTR